LGSTPTIRTLSLVIKYFKRTGTQGTSIWSIDEALKETSRVKLAESFVSLVAFTGFALSLNAFAGRKLPG
jgi:hypothetical protein